MEVGTILAQIDLGSIALPEFQRGYVWNRDQVRGLMHSLYRKYPVGSLLVWVTPTEGANTKGDGKLSLGSVRLLLDGQQRITSLYGIIKGQPPTFFQGNAQAFTGLYFNLDDEVFEFYSPAKMANDARWVNLTQLMQEGSGVAIRRLVTNPELNTRVDTYANRLIALDAIKQIDLHIEEVAGEDKTVDVVVDIFNRVNSGGTKLSKGDLALAKLCAQWPEARRSMNQKLAKWSAAGFEFNLDWLLRNATTIVTGQALFSGLEKTETAAFIEGLSKAEKACDYLLNLLSSRLGLDHDRVLGGRYAFPVMARFVSQNGGQVRSTREVQLLLYWYIHSFLWGRFSGSTETVLNQDLKLLDPSEGALGRLIDELRYAGGGDLRVRPEDFGGWSLGARFYPLLYLLTRVGGAANFSDGLSLSAHMLGKLARLQVHHIFPRALLYEAGYQRPEVNSLANFCFLTQECNLEVGARHPEEYLAEYEKRHPGVVASQWIPMDRELWRIEHFRDFLAARRKLLADAANQFLDSLLKESLPAFEPPHILEQVQRATEVVIAEDDNEERQLLDCIGWIAEHHLPDGELMYELTADDGSVLAILDLVWPNGLQPGLSQPVAILLGEPADIEAVVNQAGYRYFTSVADFKRYVTAEVLSEPALATA